MTQRRYYLAETWHGKPGSLEQALTRRIVEVNADGMTRGRQVAEGWDRADRYALVMAGDLGEAREKFQAGEVVQWYS